MQDYCKLEAIILENYYWNKCICRSLSFIFPESHKSKEKTLCEYVNEGNCLPGCTGSIITPPEYMFTIFDILLKVQLVKSKRRIIHLVSNTCAHIYYTNICVLGYWGWNERSKCSRSSKGHSNWLLQSFEAMEYFAFNEWKPVCRASCISFIITFVSL